MKTLLMVLSIFVINTNNLNTFNFANKYTGESIMFKSDVSKPEFKIILNNLMEEESEVFEQNCNSSKISNLIETVLKNKKYKFVLVRVKLGVCE